MSESVHVCINVFEADFRNFCDLVHLRWFMIGYALYQLIHIWKENKNKIENFTRIDAWLPNIVQQSLPPNMVKCGSYQQLRCYAYIWEHREIVNALPKLRDETTNSLRVMREWIKLCCFCYCLWFVCFRI